MQLRMHTSDTGMSPDRAHWTARSEPLFVRPVLD